MKNINKKQSVVDPIAEARKNNNFSLYAKESRVNVRLAVEAYAKRKEKGWSQDRLAKEISTTQKIISNIESGDVNIGIGLLKRLVDGLTLTTENLGKIFESCSLMPSFLNTASASKHENIRTHEDIFDMTISTNQT